MGSDIAAAAEAGIAMVTPHRRRAAGRHQTRRRFRTEGVGLADRICEWKNDDDNFASPENRADSATQFLPSKPKTISQFSTVFFRQKMPTSNHVSGMRSFKRPPHQMWDGCVQNDA